MAPFTRRAAALRRSAHMSAGQTTKSRSPPKRRAHRFSQQASRLSVRRVTKRTKPAARLVKRRARASAYARRSLGRPGEASAGGGRKEGDQGDGNGSFTFLPDHGYGGHDAGPRSFARTSDPHTASPPLRVAVIRTQFSA